MGEPIKMHQPLTDAQHKAIELFTNLVTDQYTLESLAQILDRHIWKHTTYLLRDNDIEAGEHNVDGLAAIRALRNTCQGKEYHV